MYTEQLGVMFNKFVADEISSAMLYTKIAEQARGVGFDEFSEQLSKNALEEFGHFQEIITYASNHGISINLNINPEIIFMNYLDDIESDILQITNLELNAANDYKTIVLLARKNEDIETEAFFTEIMQDEQKHADGLNKISKVSKIRPLSFRDYVNL